MRCNEKSPPTKVSGIGTVSRNVMSKINQGTVVFTVEEVAEVLRLSRNSAYRGIERGEIPSIKVGRRLLVPRPALERLLGLDLPAGDETEDAEAADARFRARRRLWKGGS
jgi:excisionase family DNA binding protein